MPSETFLKLLHRYADGRQICNCSQAYADMDGPTATLSTGKVVYLRCRYGCQTNQLEARDEIADRIVFEFL